MDGAGAAEPSFELLGPLRVRLDGRPADLGPAQQRLVLAVLLTHANRHVDRAQLIDAVWGPSAPAYAVNLLQKHVSRLRRILVGEAAPVGASPLTWSGGGYQLSVPAGRLDLDLFLERVDRARASRAVGDDRQAADLLRAALTLWRGTPFDGLDGPWVRGEQARLGELRMAALEERLDVDLVLGGHAELLEELRGLVAAHPSRERLRALLMGALDRSGRRADALAEFERARRQMRDELGIDPGAALRRAQQQILEAPPASTPAQLPHGMPHFAGRTTHLRELDALADDPRRDSVVVITALAGTAGVGKTALAVHWAHRSRSRFSDGQLYVNLRGFDASGSVMEPAEAIRMFLDALDVPPQAIPVSIDAQAGLYRSLLAGRQILVVLDNARDAEQVRPLLPGAPGCFVVVTSRNALTGLVAGEGAYPLMVDLLSIEEARQLLVHRLGWARVEAEPGAVEQIIQLSARLPLALAIVAARAAARPSFPLSAIATELRRALGRLDAFDGGDGATDVRAVFSWSYRELGEPAARLFRLLGLHPGPDVSVAAAASLAGLPPEQVRPLLAELARAHLIEELSPGRFGIHDLLRAYAAEQAHGTDSPAESSASVLRTIDHYLHAAHGVALRLHPQRDPLRLASPMRGVTVEMVADTAAAGRWFAAEHQVLQAVLTEAAASGADEYVCRLAWAMMDFLHYQGHWHDQITVQRAALDAARRLGNRSFEAGAHRALVGGYTWLGHYADAAAHAERARALYAELGDHAGEAYTHRSVAWALVRQGRHREALEHANHALALYRRVGRQAGEANALNQIGWYHAQLGDHAVALERCREAFALHKKIGNRYGMAETSDSLGFIQHHLGQHDEAVACYAYTVDEWHDLGHRYGEATALTRLGDVHAAADDRAAARRAWERALVILDHLRHPEAADLRTKLTH